MNEPELPPVNVKVIARVGLGLVALAALVIVGLTFGPFRDRSAPDGGTTAEANLRAPGSGTGEASTAQSGKTAQTGDASPVAGAKDSGSLAAPPGGDAGLRSTAGGAADKTQSTPAFDVVRVEPNGESVVAGRAAPHAMVELLADDGSGAPPRVIQKGAADAAGLFAFTGGPLPRGRHVFSLRVTGPDGVSVTSRQAVNVEINPPRPPLVALVDPDRPTVLLSRPDGPLQTASDAAQGQTRPAGQGAAATVATAGAARVVQVETDDAGKLFVVGKARPGATLRLYLNDALLASGVANAQGVVEFSMDSSLPHGAYRVRLDEVDPGTGKVLSRAETPWDSRQTGQGQEQGAGDTTTTASTTRGEPVSGERHATGAKGAQVVKVPPVRTHVVTRGDSLWAISRRTYRFGSRYTTIYEANQHQIADRDLIYPGQVFVIPDPKRDAP